MSPRRAAIATLIMFGFVSPSIVAVLAQMVIVVSSILIWLQVVATCFQIGQSMPPFPWHHVFDLDVSASAFSSMLPIAFMQGILAAAWTGTRGYLPPDIVIATSVAVVLAFLAHAADDPPTTIVFGLTLLHICFSLAFLWLLRRMGLRMVK